MSQPRPPALSPHPQTPALAPPQPALTPRARKPALTPRRPSSLVICDLDGAQLFTGESLLGVQLGGLRVGPRRHEARGEAGHG